MQVISTMLCTTISKSLHSEAFGPLACSSDFFIIPRHCSAYLHHSAQPRSILGLTTICPHLRHFCFGSSLKNSTVRPQPGHFTSKISSGFQNLLSCPGHLSIIHPFIFNLCSNHCQQHFKSFLSSNGMRYVGRHYDDFTS